MPPSFITTFKNAAYLKAFSQKASKRPQK